MTFAHAAPAHTAPALDAAALATKYDQRVPRYTSYPTAPHFAAAVGEAEYRRWLAALPSDSALSLYFHIPFCDEMCWFCGCHTKVVRRYEPIRAYLDLLLEEIALVAAALPGRFAARHLHWGGGSPTVLSPEDWLRLTRHLRGHFTIAEDAELAVEIDPRDATEAYIAALAEAGVNRVSIGVQDFDADVQTAINRFQPFETVERVTGWLRRHGIARINVDLMYGLPRQTVDRVERTVAQVLALAPSRLALFGYAHVPWMKAHQRLIDESELPDAAERLRQLAAAARVLEASGYRTVGLDHFARADDPLVAALAHGRLHRNFQGYTSDDAQVLLGFGASAIGTLPQGYVQNVSPIAEYRRTVALGRLPIGRGVALDDDDRLRRAIIERLMCALAVDLDAECRALGLECQAFGGEIDQLAALVADGLVRIDGPRIVVTAAGRPFVRLVAAAFDAYLMRGTARHSRAI